MSGTYYTVSTGRPGRRRINASATGVTAQTLTRDNDFVRCTGTLTINLPAAATMLNHTFHIKNIGTGVITVASIKSETIDEQANITLAQYDSIAVISDGTEWWII